MKTSFYFRFGVFILAILSPIALLATDAAQNPDNSVNKQPFPQVGSRAHIILVSKGTVTVGFGATQALGVSKWQSPARLHGRFTKTSGVLRIDEQGVEFRPAKGSPVRWSFLEIQTFDLTPHEVTVIGYENRDWHLPGDRSYRFDVSTPVPPAVAAELRNRVGKPARNGDPEPSVMSLTAIPARHRTHFGGSNGLLRFRDEGIDYVTLQAGDSRSWRWADIRTVSSADAYHLTVFGYLETYSFDLKEPLKQKTYDGLNDEVYRHQEELRENSDKGKRGVAE
jgi:hypothetical protein